MTNRNPATSKAISKEAAFQQIEANLGSQFDRVRGNRFIALGEAGEFDHIILHSQPGIPLRDCPLCGPVIVVGRTLRAGDYVHCPVCGTRVRIADAGLNVSATGESGRAEDLEPTIDADLVEAMIADAAPHLSFGRELPAAAWTTRFRRWMSRAGLA